LTSIDETLAFKRTAHAAVKEKLCMKSTRRFILGICATLALVLFLGCAESERREMRVEQEQHEGEVVEEAPGEMIVE
jgi:hypothetical protein